MNVFWEEHGEIITSSIVGIIVIGVFLSECMSVFIKLMPDYITQKSNDNYSFIEQIQEGMPEIIADELIYVTCGEEFDPLRYVYAIDCDGKDISQFINVRGNVDSDNKGLYTLYCFVKASNGIIAKKYINVIVE